MKRGTPDHPKARRLAVELNLARYEVVGLLESIWHFAAGYAKRGDIGRFSDFELAAHLGWEPGSHEVLIRKLVLAGWLDRCPCHRLRVHHWPDHADQTVSRSDEVKKRGFLECYGTDFPPEEVSPEEVMLVTTSVSKSRADLPLPLPLPVPTPEPVPEPVLVLASATAVAPARKGSVVSEACDDWNERYGPGSAPGGKISGAIPALVKAVAKSLHEPEPESWSGTVRPAWRRYLAENDHPSPSPANFREHFADWTVATESAGMVPTRARASPPNTARAQRGLDGINALIEGGLKGDGTL